MNMAGIINQMIVLFLMIAFGYTVAKKGIITPQLAGGLSSIVVKITCPMMILYSVLSQKPETLEQISMGDVVYVFILSLVLYIIFPILGFGLNGLLRTPEHDKRLYIFMTTFSNVAFMGFPVIEAIYTGEQGKIALFYAAIFNLTFNLFVFTFGVSLMSGTSGKGKISLKALLNPGIIAAITAILLFAFGLTQYVPEVIVRVCQTMGGMTTPLAMLVIGTSLASVPMQEVFQEYRLYPYGILKQGVAPVILFFVFRMFISDPMILAVTIVVAAMPVAATTVMFSKEYGQDDVKAAKGVFMTTLISIITIPLIVWLINSYTA